MVQRTRGARRTGWLGGQNATRGSDLSGAWRGTAIHGAGPASQPAGDQGDGSDAGPAHNRLRPSNAALSFILGQVEGCPELAKGPVSKTGGAQAPCGFESHPLRHIPSFHAIDTNPGLSLGLGPTRGGVWGGTPHVVEGSERSESKGSSTPWPCGFRFPWQSPWPGNRWSWCS